MKYLEGIAEFCAVAEVGNFTGAANKLDTSVAQISRKVASLEKQLGVKLLHRTTRSVSLTEAGTLYCEQALPALKALEDAQLSVSALQNSPQGLIKLTAPVAFGEAFIAPLLNAFMQKYSGISVQCIFSNEKLDIVDMGLDLAIRIGKLEDSTLVAKKLSTRHLYVCASEQYFKENGRPKTLEDLKKHTLLVGSQPYWRFLVDKTIRAIPVQGRVRYNSGNALCSAAIAGLGLAQLPGFYVREALASGKLIEVFPQYKDKQEAIWAVFPSNRNVAPKIRLLVDFLAQHIVSDS
ncbi:LysR substrate-binding domain-containing protein [Alteromonas mediterranea]|uniref:LysR family transcriptional regulator n=1 Tax=Alteromonas mediterranea (strain DSM 17117 / CIP 110805 / LMG 28347 / Deep ecotype) TaxID=1774373 RepID=F2GD94_ALTMD|nr:MULTISPECIES: LysR substrate-binding domain-containing protein [Alteromonas]AEA99230.1 LysR family transcriptional regulator [Alteromonas mediterranea DE]MBR9785238.1 LysR family transcriptional regulator [Gammaproteobacteria bacterium]MBR9894812.1 LysR family transcriptional regulator [Gammaproteobacteria bacterium]CAH1208351.1 HTH-type transcriptional regulator DmlR [Alteromonas mediterranea]